MVSLTKAGFVQNKRTDSHMVIIIRNRTRRFGTQNISDWNAHPAQHFKPESRSLTNTEFTHFLHGHNKVLIVNKILHFYKIFLKMLNFNTFYQRVVENWLDVTVTYSHILRSHNQILRVIEILHCRQIYSTK